MGIEDVFDESSNVDGIALRIFDGYIQCFCMYRCDDAYDSVLQTLSLNLEDDPCDIGIISDQKKLEDLIHLNLGDLFHNFAAILLSDKQVNCSKETLDVIEKKFRNEFGRTNGKY